MKSYNTQELIEALTQKGAYPFAVEKIDVLQTHISILFFAGEWVYKVKKNVSFYFLDFSTLAQRRFFCEEEVRLNRRLSPEIYEGVVPITVSYDGVVKLESDGEVVEYAVKMKRLSHNRLMGHLLDKGEIDNELIERVIQKLVTFHQSLVPHDEIKKFGQYDNVRKNVMGNFDGLEDFKEQGGVSEVQFSFLKQEMETFFEHHGDMIDRRAEQGFVKEGHGDLHAGNVCVLDESLVIYDCIEFSPAFRCGDVASDIAFFAMDLDKRGFRAFSKYFVKRYAELTHDTEFSFMVDFYKVYRALVRAKVAAIQSVSEDVNGEERMWQVQEARHYIHLALSYLMPPPLILTCGLPASGKSWAARHIAEPFEAVILRSDVIRKRLAGIELTEHNTQGFEGGIYTKDFTQKTYDKVLELAKKHLQGGRAVIVDASFYQKKWRQQFADLARELSLPFATLELKVDEEEIKRRMQLRQKDHHEVSDAGFETYQKMAERFEALDAEEHQRAVVWSGKTAKEAMIGDVFDRLLS